MTRTIALGLVALYPLAATTTHAQRCDRNGGMGGNRFQGVYPNEKYDGRFIFARVYYGTALGGGGFRRGGGGDPPWHHDYPRAPQHLTKLLTELTTIRTRVGAGNVFALDDPELMKYPIAYLSEPGHWFPSDAEVKGLRTYLTKGGFLIFDDFALDDIVNLENQMLRVLPGMRLIELTPEHPIFDAFYRVKTLDYYHPYYCYKSGFYGIFQDNDPTKRMLAIVNHNNDIGEAWEWSDQGFFSIDVTNDAYKLGINYFVYALTR